MTELTDNHKLLLAIGLSRGERLDNNKYLNTCLRYDDAKRLYADSAAAHSAIVSLNFKGYIETTDTCGIFVVVKAPPECELKADELRRKRKEKNGY
jgi:hypothetical protein